MEKYDYLIVLSKNWKGILPGRINHKKAAPELSFLSKLTAYAAAEAIKNGLAGEYIISGGKTAGSEHPSEAEAIRNYLLERSLILPEYGISLDSRSIDTADQAKMIKDFFGRSSRRKVAVLGTKYHLPRALGAFQSEGLDVEGVEVEKYLGKRSKHHKNLLKKIRHSFPIRLERIRESFIYCPLSKIDKKSKLMRLITRKIRA